MTEALAGTVDAFLGGRVEAIQPADGSHRAGLEAVLLAGSVDAGFIGTVVDLGAGVGVAGMCAASRCRQAEIVLVERDAASIDAARAALARPANAAFASRTRIVAADILAPEPERIAAGLGRAFADLVITNPPFNFAGEGTSSPVGTRAEAHVLAAADLDAWLRTAASILRPGGTLTVIFRADGLDAVLAGMAGRFGAVAILPIYPRAVLPAHRILVRGVKGSRARLAVLPGLILHGEGGNAYLPPVEAMLRGSAGLAEIHPSWGL